MFSHIIGEMFRWPDGIVVGNLIASAIWAVPSLWHLNRKLNRHHQWHVDNNSKGNS